MNRDKIKKLYGIEDGKWLDQTEKAIESVIDKVVDAFESEKCVNCKHDRSYTRNCEAYVGRPAYDDASWKYEQVGDFSCDLWEAKS